MLQKFIFFEIIVLQQKVHLPARRSLWTYQTCQFLWGRSLSFAPNRKVQKWFPTACQREQTEDHGNCRTILFVASIFWLVPLFPLLGLGMVKKRIFYKLHIPSAALLSCIGLSRPAITRPPCITDLFLTLIMNVGANLEHSKISNSGFRPHIWLYRIMCVCGGGEGSPYFPLLAFLFPTLPGTGMALITARNEVGARLYFHRRLSFC